MTTKGNMSEDKVKKLIELWDKTDIQDIAKELGVSKFTIKSWSAKVNELSNDKLCKPKPKKRVTMVDTIVSVLADMQNESKEE